MRIGVIAQGAKALSSSAPGNRKKNLFRSDPSAIFQTRYGSIVDDDANCFGAGFPGSCAYVIEGGGGELRDCCDVVE
jgi:hypothetical protein